MFDTTRQRLREARSRAFQAYEAKYGEPHPSDPRTVETLVMFSPEHEAWVAEVLRARNEGRPVPMPYDL